MTVRKTKSPAITPPEHLDERARGKWAEVLQILRTRGEQLDGGALDALACYCQAWSRWTAAETKVNELGAVVKSPAGFAVPNPYLTVAKDAQRQMRQWAAELKLTPKAKGRKTAADEPGSELTSLIKGRLNRTGRKGPGT